MGWHKYKNKPGYYYRGRTKSGKYYTKGRDSSGLDGTMGIFEIILLILLLIFAYKVFKPYFYW